MKHHIKITYASKQDADSAAHYIQRCRKVLSDGSDATPLYDAAASTLLCALGRAEPVKQEATGTLGELTPVEPYSQITLWAGELTAHMEARMLDGNTVETLISVGREVPHIYKETLAMAALRQDLWLAARKAEGFVETLESRSTFNHA